MIKQEDKTKDIINEDSLKEDDDKMETKELEKNKIS